MDNKQVIQKFQEKIDWAKQNRYPYVSESDVELYKMAIDALAVPSAEPCEDAISRQAVLEMAYDMSEIDGEHFTEPCMVVDVEDIQKLPPVKQEPKWIPVSERLPESDGNYLLFGKVVEDEDTEHIFIGMYDACAEKFGYWEDYYDRNTLGFLDSELIEYNKVIAWMPLPKPYELQENKKVDCSTCANANNVVVCPYTIKDIAAEEGCKFWHETENEDKERSE